MGLVFLILSALIIALSLIESKDNSPKAIIFGTDLFKTGAVFNIASMGIALVLGVLYTLFW
jgi:SSS family solute:Na+ symporter